MQTVVLELLNYKNNPDINPVTLLNYTYDLIHAERHTKSVLLRQINYIKDKTSRNIEIPLSVIEFIYNAHKNQKTTSHVINIKDNFGRVKNFTLYDIIILRQNAIKEIIEIQAKVIKDYTLDIKYNINNNAKSLNGIKEVLDSE